MANSIINPGLRADIMRKRIEDKNTLRQKGSLIVGTGTKTTVNFNGVDIDIWDTYQLAIPYELDSYTMFIIDEEEGAKYMTLPGVQVIEPFSIPAGKLEDTLNATYVLTTQGVTAENLQDPTAGIATQTNGIDFTLNWTEDAGFGLTRNSNNIGNTSTYADTVTYCVDSSNLDVNIANYINTTEFQVCNVDSRSYETYPIILWENSGGTGWKQIANINVGDVVDILKITLIARVWYKPAAGGPYYTTQMVDMFPGYDGWGGNTCCYVNGSSGFLNLPGAGRLSFQTRRTTNPYYIEIRCNEARRNISYASNYGTAVGALWKVDTIGGIITYVLPAAIYKG